MFIEVEKRDGTRCLINTNNIWSIEPGKDDNGNEVIIIKGNDGYRTIYSKIENLGFLKSILMCRKK